MNSGALHANNVPEGGDANKGNAANVDYDEISEQNACFYEKDMGDEPEMMTEEEKNKKHGQLLFWTQGVGSTKQVGGIDVYVKHEHCEESLKELFKYLKFDSQREPYVRQTLGKWNFLSKDLLPLLIFHH